ncbi:DUF3237 domain-containing protein [Nisaea sp.]|uniref:DUF3237 domain-containing protein n=1 Tax=Nisaea sp. TaxID=2024842 RepID=UPI00326527E6
MRAAPALRPVCMLTVDLSSIRELGRGRAGKRRIIPIVGGRVEGPELNGVILGIGADWQTVYDDGCAFLDARYAFETPDGGLIEVVNRGFRHGSPEVMERLAAGDPVDSEDYYMRTTASLETGDPRYDWVNRTLFVGTGTRLPSAVEIALFAVT